MSPISEHEEKLAATGERKSRGAYYTPADVVEGLLRLCLDPLLAESEGGGWESVAAIRVLDPTCGSGNFLAAALQRVRDSLHRCGLAAADAAALALKCVVGVDVDSDAVELCRARLSSAAGQDRGSAAGVNIVCADSLVMPLERPLTLFTDENNPNWAAVKETVGATDGFDVVVGNPPFINQLRSSTNHPREYSAQVAHRFGDLAHGYTDPAALFLIVGLQLLKQGSGRLCLLQPLSSLASRNVANVRSEILREAALVAAWFPLTQVFEDAAVEVWGPVVSAGEGTGTVKLIRGREFAPALAVPMPHEPRSSWAPLLAAAKDVPMYSWESNGVLGDIAEATADFRDQYYGLDGAVYERSTSSGSWPKLVTSGLIDPARLLWGERSTRFNRVTFLAPRVDVSMLRPDMQDWAQSRLVPKVLVSTQSRVLEPFVDYEGALLPSVPVITVTSGSNDLWSIAALLVSPPITAIAATRHLGAALSSDALKLSATDLLDLPIPRGSEDWLSASHEFQKASSATTNESRLTHLVECGRHMCLAFGVSPTEPLLEWWSERLPAKPDDTSRSAQDEEYLPATIYGPN